jgi:arylsulfatase A-like enzyme
MRVPMIVAGPGVRAAGVVKDRVGTIDVLPTAMGLLGFESDRNLLGQDLRPFIAGRSLNLDALYGESLFGRLSCHWAALREWTKGDWKLIVGHETELYNLAEIRASSATSPPKSPIGRRMTDELQRGLGGRAGR